MPGFDGTGPRGQGSMTGGGRGYCAMPVGEVNRQFGRGVYGRKGRWMRAQRGMQAFGEAGRPLSKEDELSALKTQAEYLKGELDAVQARVQDLESK